MENAKQIDQLINDHTREELNQLAKKINASINPENLSNKLSVAELIAEKFESNKKIRKELEQSKPGQIEGSIALNMGFMKKKMAPVTLTGKTDEEKHEEETVNPDSLNVDFDDVKDDGEKNSAPLELTVELKDELLEKEAKNTAHLEEVRNASVHFNNGKNEWKLIQKTYNNELGYQHMTMAMKIGTRGVLVVITEGLNNRTTMTSMFLDNGVLDSTIDKDGQKLYFLH